jgi:hypothetical protein
MLLAATLPPARRIMAHLLLLRSRCKSIEEFDAAREGVDPLFKVNSTVVVRGKQLQMQC